MRTKLTGSFTYPAYTAKCNDCLKEFTISSARPVLDKTICPQCGNGHISIMYVSFPTDGPGFQDGYDPKKLINGC